MATFFTGAFGIIVIFVLFWFINKTEKIEKNTKEIIDEIKDLKEQIK